MAARGDVQDRMPAGECAPQRPLLALQSPAGLVHVHRLRAPDPLEQILVWLLERVAAAGKDRVDRAGREPRAEQLLAQLDHVTARDPIADRQGHDRRLQPGPERAASDLGRQLGALSWWRTVDSARAGTDARSRSSRAPAAPRPDDGPARRPRRVRSRRTHGHSHTRPANAQPPHHTPNLATVPDRALHDRAEHPARAASDLSASAGALAGPDSAAATSCASPSAAPAQAARPELSTAGSDDPSATAPRPRPHDPRRKSPQPRAGPHPLIRRSVLMSPYQLNAY